MNVFNKVTLASLKKNRTRTVVTIIGIMLSAAMICASTTFVASMQNFVLRYTVYKTGDFIGVKGFVFRTQTGEISVHAKELCLLSKSFCIK